ncbi:winged helix-turn-helix domain-containing protein [uncultured Ferrimonas sp.]|uniref:winged helix-turn-helix domain-containing protein n=1 Tax=uncultured Ferrimonas sp. TaxID=432640 RepID=UPI0026385145|nr:winged helix-turn-helix domain-containing protein [uncultured Ferrimonas sp.]
MKLSEHLQIDLERRELVDGRSHQSVPLSFAELAILLLLQQRQGEVVDKQSLTDAGWPGRVVAQSSLTQCISTLRRKLQQHHDIELKTIPRYGYSLCQAGQSLAEAAPAQPMTAATAAPCASARSEHPQQPSSRRPLALLLVSLFVVVGTVAMLHVNGTLPHWVDTLRLQQQPGVEAISTEQIQIGAHPNLVHHVQFEQNNTPQPLAATEFVSNWQRIDEMMPQSKPQQSYLKQSQDFDSIALCANYNGRCKDALPLNLVRRHQQQPPLDLKWLYDTKLRMEQVTYNKILLNRFEEPQDGLLENVYRADVYYYGDSANVVRGDLRFSVVNQSEGRGQLLVAACFTDASSDISMRYEFSGPFIAEQQQLDGQTVTRYLVEIENQNFRRPAQLSEEGAVIYRELQKAVLGQKQMTLHQLYQDEQSGVWILPLWGETVVWAHRAQLKL